MRSRQAATVFPSGGNQYSINGVRALRFELQSGGDMFLDPATIRLAFTLKNLDATADNNLRLLANSPLCLFQRLRVLMKGTLVKDINYLHGTENMFDILLPPQRRKSQALQMLGDATLTSYNATAPLPDGMSQLCLHDLLRTTVRNEPIPPECSRKVLCPLLSGLLSASQPHWIRLKMAPLTIELEINPLVNQYPEVAPAASSSSLWSLEDAQIKVDLSELDAVLADRVYGMIRSSGLQFSFSSFNTTINVLRA